MNHDWSINWSTPETVVGPRAGEIQVWRTALPWPAEAVSALGQVLSAEEVALVSRKRREQDRMQFIVGRGLLRVLLGSCLNMLPTQVRIATGPFGKPRIVEPPSARDLSFNVAHAGRLILIALTFHVAIGIDVEEIAGIDWQQIATHHFSLSERRVLEKLPNGQLANQACAYWTLKEAYVKASGQGLSIPMNQFDVHYIPGEPARLLETRNAPGDHLRWTLLDLDAGEGYKAALAVDGVIAELNCWDWPAGAMALPR